MQLTLENARELIHNAKNGRLRTMPHIVVIEVSNWISYEQYDERSCIFLDERTHRYYQLKGSREGNYWEGYDYEYDTEAEEVFRKEVTTYEWVARNHQSDRACT